MKIGKVGWILFGLVILGFIFVATFSTILPSIADYFQCVLQAFANPNSGKSFSACAAEIEINFGASK